MNPLGEPEIDEEEIFEFLRKRKGILDGVCVTGGEPTLGSGLKEFLGKIKEIGYKVKLDTNGSRPEIVKELAEAKLLDMVAMDIKSSPKNYGKLTGLETVDIEAVKETAEFLMKGELPYEFRTTVVRELHSESDFREIGKWIAGAKAYFLQAYKDSDGVLMPGFSSYSADELKVFRDIVRETVPLVEIRGID